MTDWLALAQTFRPRLEAARGEAERQRRFPHSLIREMAEAGLFRLKLPARYGGTEVDHLSYFQLIEELSRTDASAGWLVAIGNEGAVCAGYLPEQAADDIFASDQNVIIAASLKSRRADVRPVDGGYRVRGQWALASGCPEAGWLGGVAVVHTDAGPRPGPDGRPELLLFMLPRQDCIILDTWDALGLRATASHDFVVEDAFVPEHRKLALPGAASQLPGPLWRGDLRTHLGGAAAVSLGIARVAIDELVALAADKVPLFSRSALRDRATAQAKVGQAEALVRSARAFLHEVLAAMWQTQCQGQAPTGEQLALRELAVAHAAQSSAHAVRLMYDAAGSDAVYASSTLERCFRDVHVVTQHVAGSTNRYEEVGRLFMDADVRPR